VRRIETIDEATGRPSISESTYRNQVGSVVPGDPHNVVRTPEGQMTGRTISVISRFRFRGAGDGHQPDHVVHQGVRFTVNALVPWTHFGAGFVLAVAQSQSAADPAP
jgi:hypothetical protein